MHKRSSRKPDINEIAFSVAQAIASGTSPPGVEGKNPLAVALGRRGGLKGGKARAASLTSAKRSEIARIAAQCRWARRTDEGNET